MAITTAPDLDELLSKVEDLAPLIRKYAAQAERDRHLTPLVLEALRDAGFFRMFRSAERGGFELDPVSEFRVAEAIARVDSAAAWNVQVCNAGELYAGWFDASVTEATFGQPEAIIAGSFNPHRKAVVTDGGYIISGRSPFNSNCNGATWFIGLADVYDGETLRVDQLGMPEVLLTLFSATDSRIIENWNTMGMCGTGSHDIEVENLFVPSGFAAPFGPLENPSNGYESPLYYLAIWATVGCHATVALGIAQAAIDGLIELGQKIPAYTERSLRDRNSVQLRLAQAEAKLSAARAFFHNTFENAWSEVQAHTLPPLKTKAQCQLAGCYATSTAAEVVDLVHSCVGATGIRNESPFQKHFRDAHVITQHAFVAESRMEAVGQIMFGIEPDWPFFDF